MKFSPTKLRKIGADLLRWYAVNARQLPWRGVRDPYRVWISEVMLQQTRVETVIPYYQRWMAALPDIPSLVETGEDRVLQLWEGLGYYQRARNIFKTGVLLSSRYGGRLPDTHAELKKLPGIGEYIAGAVASIAFGLDEIALDGNGLRVIARLVEYPQVINNPKNLPELREVMRAMLPRGEAGDFNQAMMDLGSMLCVPRVPVCAECPLAGDCLAKLHTTQKTYPQRQAKPIIPHYDVVAAVIRRGEEVLIDKRKANGLLGGLWEFPGGKVEAGESLPDALTREIQEELSVDLEVQASVGTYQHAYTHFRVSVHVFEGKINAGTPQALAADEIRWEKVERLGEYPMGKVDRLIARALLRGL